MTRALLLLVALLGAGCHTTVYRSESTPVRIHATRQPRPATDGGTDANGDLPDDEGEPAAQP